MNLDNFLNTLFTEGDLICFTSEANGYRAYNSPADKDIFFSINCLQDQDHDPSKPWHNRGIPRRADTNVLHRRNFLLELDSMALDAQIKYVCDLVPVTSIVYSGAKSHHFIISITEPISAPEYAQLARRLHKHVPAADPTTKNPSRLSRLPFRVRPETGKLQELKYLGGRIKFSELDALLPQLPVYAPRTIEQTRMMVTPQLLRAAHEPDAVMQEFNIGGRNALFYWLHMRCQELGLEEAAKSHFVAMAYSNLQSKDGFGWAEACMAARIKS